MKIVYILPEFVTEQEAGGLATYYDNISRMLADAGHIITIFVQADVTETVNYYNGITVERVYIDLKGVNPNIPGSFIRCWSAGLQKALCDSIAMGAQYDLVQYPNFMGYAIDRINIPTVVRISSYRPFLRAADQEEFDVYAEYKSIKAPDFIEDIAVLKADAIYGPSVITADYIKKQTGRIVEIIESPYYPRSRLDYSLEDNKAWIREKKYAITFGTLKILKGAKLIGDCIFEIMDKCPNLYWVFAGAEMEWIDGKGERVSPSQYIREHARQYSERLVFLGKLEHDKLFSYVSAADFCVMPSRVDNLPNTCIEAMSLRKIVIGTIGASFEQLIDDGENGFLIERENREMLIATVCKAYCLDEKKKAEMGMKAEERIKRMNPNIILKELVSFYNNVIDNYELRSIENDVYYDRAVTQYNEILIQSGICEAEQYLL